ncbi:MAG: hypothetical protein RL095_486 [Verrucomicrobiota bacterium]|jgi:very-short-patch-repair endonuclease
MSLFIFIAFAMALILICAKISVESEKLKFKEGVNEEDSPKYRSKNLLTSYELILYKKLKESLPDHDVHAQVGLSRVIEPIKDGDFNAFNLICRKSLDFIICQNNRIIACIELDDPSHDRPSRQKADRQKNEALKSAGLRIIRWKGIPTSEEIRREISSI